MGFGGRGDAALNNNVGAFETVCRYVARAVQVTLLVLRAMAGDVAATGAVLLLAVGAHCHTLWRCRLVSGVVLLTSLDGRPVLSCMILVLTFVEPLFPPKAFGELRVAYRRLDARPQAISLHTATGLLDTPPEVSKVARPQASALHTATGLLDSRPQASSLQTATGQLDSRPQASSFHTATGQLDSRPEASSLHTATGPLDMIWPAGFRV